MLAERNEFYSLRFPHLRALHVLKIYICHSLFQGSHQAAYLWYNEEKPPGRKSDL